MTFDRAVRWRWPAFAVIVLVLGLLMPGVKSAAVPDNALTVWFLETDPQLQSYHAFQDTFGNDEVILLCVEEPDGVFRGEALTRLRGLSEELVEVEGIERVHSLFNMRDAVRSGDYDIAFEHVVPDPLPESDAALAVLGERLVDNPLFRDRLVSEDGTRAMLWVQMAVMDDIDNRRDAIVAEVRRVAAEHLDETGHQLGGIGVIYSGLNVITQHDFGLFVGVGYLLMFIALGVVFRSARLVLAAIGVITAGTIAALGVYGLAGNRLNMVTVVLPTLIIVLATADAVHFPTAYFALRRRSPDAGRIQLVGATLRHVLAPCILTTLTTMAGFLALSSAPMAVIRHLGIYSAIGIGSALLVCVVFMVLALMSLSDTARAPRTGWIEGLLDWVRSGLEHRRTLLAGLSVAIFAIAIAGWTQIENDTYTIGYLPDDHEVVVDHQRLEAGWGAYAPLDYSVQPAEGLRMDDPEVLEGMERFVAAASELDAIRSGFSLHTVYRRMAQVFDRPESEPLSPAAWAQLGELLRSQRLEWDREVDGYDDNYLAPVVSRDYREGRVTLISSMMSARQLERLLSQLDGIAAETLGGVATLAPNGYPPLYVRIIDYVMASQIRSFVLAMGIIFAMLWIFLRSFRLALASLPANLFPIAVMMGLMGALGIHLDVATATVAAIVIGVAVDDSIHFLYAWREAEKQGLDWADATEHCFGVAGRAAVVTTALLVIGFPILMLGQVKTVFYFGLLTTVAAVAALYADLVILPLSLRLLGKRSDRIATSETN